MIGRILNPGRSSFNSSQSVYSLKKDLTYGHQPTCLCSACQSRKQFQSPKQAPQYFNFVQAPGNIIPQNQATQGNNQPQTDPNDETPDPALDALMPPAEDVKKNQIVKNAIKQLPVNIYAKEAEDCLSKTATLVDPNDKKHPGLTECISEIPQDLQDQQKGVEQVYTGYDPATHAYFEIVDKRTDRKVRPMGFKQLIQFVLAHAKTDSSNKWINPYVIGVEMHERLHESILRSIPDVKVESFNQGVRFVITGSTDDPKFEVSTFGQSVFYADAIYDKVDQNEQIFHKAQDNFTQAANKGFSDWTQDGFASFMEALKKVVQNLRFLAQEATTLATAAVAPLGLDGTIYYEHEVLSKADKERDKEALQLRDYINNLIKDIQGFMQQAIATWNNKGQNNIAATNKPLQGAPNKQAVGAKS